MSTKKTFWDDLPTPFFAMAPMSNVTDVSFRTIFQKYGKPDVFWTEFVSSDGLCSNGKDRLLIDLLFRENQRPIVAQLFTGNPENMFESAKLVEELGFDGIDINMGCPDRTVEKQNSGAALIRKQDIALSLIASAQKTNLPVSVKTRIGYNKNEIDVWLPVLLEQNLSALTVHLRTRKEMSKCPAHWDAMKHIVSLRDSISPNTKIIGNGDVIDIEHGEKLARESGCDGIMIGRGMFGNPWVFNREKKDISVEEKLNVLIEHTKLFEKELSSKSFSIMKKHYKAYISGFDGSKELRTEIMENAENSEDVEKIVRLFLEKYLNNP